MTDRDEERVAKALQGVALPADRADLVEYAQVRGANPKTVQALSLIPDGTYHRVEDVLAEIPQQPEGEDTPGGTAREDTRQSPTHRQ